MNVFSLFSSSKLRPAWSYDATARLWRVLFGERERIVGEARDHEKKLVTFFCLDERMGKPKWENRAMAEPWWMGIEAVHGDTLLLHGFDKPDIPEHRRIFALDLETGAQRWVNEDLTFWFAYQDKVYAHQTLFEKRVGYVLSLETGEILETHNEGVEALFAVRQLAREEDQSGFFLFPSELKRTSHMSEIESIVLKQLRQKDVAGNVEYLQKDPFLLYNYHVRVSEKGLENRLMVVDSRKGREYFSDVLARDVSAPVPDSFFVKNATVYFVREQRTLVALPLPDHL